MDLYSTRSVSTTPQQIYISDLINHLQDLYEDYGDLPIVLWDNQREVDFQVNLNEYTTLDNKVYLGINQISS